MVPEAHCAISLVGHLHMAKVSIGAWKPLVGPIAPLPTKARSWHCRPVLSEHSFGASIYNNVSSMTVLWLQDFEVWDISLTSLRLATLTY